MDVKIGFDTTTHTFTAPDVDAPVGRDTLNFKRKGDHPGWTFAGISIWPSNTTKPTTSGQVCAPFNNPTPTVQDHVMVVVDNNPGGQETAFQYQVWVNNKRDGKQYSSDPQILNKGG